MTAYRVFEVEIEIVKRVHVRLPVDDAQIIHAGENIEDVAEEFALGGKSAWPQYVIREDADHDVIAVREVPQPADDETAPTLPLNGGGDAR
jgi:hypothetical protein